MSDASLSLIICTRNREGSVRRCLDALAPAPFRACGAELILVDNGSTDGTLAVLRGFAADAGFRVSVVSEARPGLSNARNAGLAAAGGEIIAFTDDDCYLAEAYLETVLRVFAEARFDYCGGRILLHDPTDAMYTVNYRRRPRVYPAGMVFRPGEIQGANMVFRRAVVERTGAFDPMLGAGTPFPFEDVDYCTRASLAGFTGAHVPELVVYHHHGRKPGAALEGHRRGNARARGAYYAKFLVAGYPASLRGWLWHVVRPRHPRMTWLELQGAYAYVRATNSKRPEVRQQRA